jgi:hypothetical protein
MKNEQQMSEIKILYGTISVKGKQKIGSFRLEYNKYSDRMEYLYYTEKGHKGTGGFSMLMASLLLEQGRLSTNPEFGKSENYI